MKGNKMNTPADRANRAAWQHFSLYSIFIMLFIGVIIVSLIFFTFESVLFISTIYLLSLPFSVFSFYKLKKVNKTEPDEDEDVL